jgi:RNA polymerase sigma-70 factor (ECF subfamily)
VGNDDITRFESIYRQNFRAILRFTLARLDPEAAKDAAAETFLICWRRLEDVPGDAAPWLFGVAKKVITGQLRSASRREALRARFEIMGAGRTTTRGIDDEVVQRAFVLAALAKLSENDREVLKLAVWDELSARVAATALRISRVAYGVRLHRARHRLSAALAEEDGSPPCGGAAHGRDSGAEILDPHDTLPFRRAKEAR